MNRYIGVVTRDRTSDEFDRVTGVSLPANERPGTPEMELIRGMIVYTCPIQIPKKLLLNLKYQTLKTMRRVVLNLTYILFLFFIVATLGNAQPKNIIFILADDHRYDYMEFHSNSPDFLKTPAMDRMAEEGAHLANAFVSTSLCSPSRASILTGQYPFRHGVVDNNNIMPEGTP